MDELDHIEQKARDSFEDGGLARFISRGFIYLGLVASSTDDLITIVDVNNSEIIYGEDVDYYDWSSAWSWSEITLVKKDLLYLHVR